MANPQIKASVVAPARERLTWREICARYPDEWVTITAFEWEGGDEDNGELLSAVVLGHSKQRGESLRATRAMRRGENMQEYAEWFTGELLRSTPPRA